MSCRATRPARSSSANWTERPRGEGVLGVVAHQRREGPGQQDRRQRRRPTPPEKTEKRAVVSEATAPDSMSPRRGPLVTTSEKTDDMRPRIASGVTVWLIVERQTALTLSAAPASGQQQPSPPTGS